MIRDTLASAVADALRQAGVEPPDELELERPARREHGDWSTNVALSTARAAGRPPRELAQQLAAALNALPPPHVEAVEVAGPGFVNFRLRDTWLHDVLTEVVEQGEENFGRVAIGGGAPVNVEFVSANPVGPIHAGGGRWAAYGDALCNLLERCGYRPHREYYLNDRGVQMIFFGESLAAVKEGRPVPEGGYQGDYINEWAAEMPAGAEPREWGYQRAVRDIKESLGRLGVHFETWFSERSLVEAGAVDATLGDLAARGVVYEADGATWLRTTDFGDDKDRVLVKSDGDYTYLLPDIAYHRDKFARGFELLIDVWGSDHHGHVTKLKAGVQALGHDPEELEIVLGQFVNIMRDGEPVKMQKRSGDLVLLTDLLDAVGPDVARLTFLLQSIDTRQTIDLDLVTSQAMENPVYYVQMAHARIAGIARVAAEAGLSRRPLESVDLALLTHERELEVLRALSQLAQVVAVAAAERAPHKITTWVRELAAAFHGFYHDCYVVSPDVDEPLAQARLWLVEAARIGLAIGLGILGVAAPETM